jgi:hypothetical protein
LNEKGTLTKIKSVDSLRHLSLLSLFSTIKIGTYVIKKYWQVKKNLGLFDKGRDATNVYKTVYIEFTVIKWNLKLIHQELGSPDVLWSS